MYVSVTENEVDAIVLPLVISLFDQNDFTVQVPAPIWSDFGMTSNPDESFGPPDLETLYPVGSDVQFRLLTWPKSEQADFYGIEIFMYTDNYTIPITEDETINEQMGNVRVERTGDEFSWVPVIIF